MSAGVLRRVAPSLRRHVATNAPATSASPSLASHTPLPAHKMRALVSLYHQAEGFITPENLSDAIDHAFLDTASHVAYGSRERFISQLRSELKERDILPKIGNARNLSADSSRGSPEGTWSGPHLDRETQLHNALYGVEMTGKPSYEVLEEEYPRIKNEMQLRKQE